MCFERSTILKRGMKSDADALAYYGYSWGGKYGPVPLALESRLKVAILEVAGLSSVRVQPEVDHVFFIPRTSRSPSSC